MGIEYENLKGLLKRSGVTLNEVAEALELSGVGLKKAFDNESLRARNFKQLADLLGLSLDELDKELTGGNYAPAPIDKTKTGAPCSCASPMSEIEFLKYLADNSETITRLIEQNKL